MRFTLLMLLIVTSLLLITVPAKAIIDVRTYDSSIDFSISSAQNIKACACALTTDTLTITNTGTFPAIFSITSDVQLSNYQVELAPMQSHEIQVFIQSSCSAADKVYNIEVKSNLGPVKTLTKNVKVERCQNLELSVLAPAQASSCTPINYNLFIKNTGTFPEEYSITSNFDRYMSYSSQYFQLFPGQVASVNATLNLDCSDYGSKNIDFTARAIQNELDAKIRGTTDVVPDFGYDLIVEKHNGNVTDVQTLEVCNRVYDTRFQVNLTNHGIDNEFTITVDDLPAFARIEGMAQGKYEITLRHSESKVFNIVVDAHKYRDQVKGFDFSMKVDPKYGEPQLKKLRLDLEPCYEHKVIIDDQTTAQKPFNICQDGFYEYDVEIRNDGRYNENYRLRLEGAPDGMQLSTYTVDVAPKTSKNVKLYIVGPKTNHIYDVKVYATIANGISESDDVWIKANDEQTCHDVDIKKTNFKINYDTQYIDVPLRSNSLEYDYYNVDLDSDSRLLQLERDKIFVNESSTLRIDIDSQNVSEGKYTYNLTLSHKSGAKYDEKIHVTLKDKAPLRKAFEHFFFGTQCRQISFWTVALIISVSVLIILFMIFGPHYPYKLGNRIRQKLPILIILIIIFIVAIIAVLMLFDRPATNREIYGLNTSLQDLHFEMLENERFVLDAKQFFTDPDNPKSLTYTVSEIRDVNTRVTADEITFTPKKGWSGERKFTITATDPQGASEESPTMTLKVLDVPRKTLPQLYEVYCWYTNLLLLLILLFLIFVAFIVKQQRRYRKR